MQKVKVVGPGADETFGTTYLGQEGTVVDLRHDDHGATPEDPYALVRLDSGKVDMFWPEELEGVPCPT